MRQAKWAGAFSSLLSKGKACSRGGRAELLQARCEAPYTESRRPSIVQKRDGELRAKPNRLNAIMPGTLPVCSQETDQEAVRASQVGGILHRAQDEFKMGDSEKKLRPKSERWGMLS